MFTNSRPFVICVVASALAAPALAQHQVYPVQKQSPEQQKQDEARCLSWAMQQTGFDPAKPWLAPQGSALPSTAGSSVRFRSGPVEAANGARRDTGDAAAAGAIIAASAQPAAGAAAGAILGEDAANVTVGGAVAGATIQRYGNPKITLQQEQPVTQQQLSSQASFEKARAACLEARGYTTQ